MTVDKFRPLTASYENHSPAGGSGMLPLHAHADVSTGAGCLSFGLNLHLHHHFVHASSEDSGEPAHLTPYIYMCHELFY